MNRPVMSSQFKYRSLPLITALIVFFLVYSIGLWLILEDRATSQAREQALLERLTDSFAREVERRIDRAISITQVMESQMQLSGPESVVENFDRIASSLLNDEDRENLIVGLAPDGIIIDVYPDHNQRVVGLNLNTDQHRREHIEQTIEAGTLTLSGPYDLVVGGKGFVARYPILLDTANMTHLWGFVTVAIKQRFLFPESNLEQFASSNIAVRLTYTDPSTNRETSLFDSGVMGNATEKLISVPGGKWRMETSKLSAHPLPNINLVWNFISAILFAIFAWVVARYPQKLREQVIFKTRESEQQKAFFNELIYSLPDGIVVSDIDGRIQYYNPNFKKLTDAEEINGASLIELLEDSFHDSSIKQFFVSRLNMNKFNFEVMLSLLPHGDFQLNCSLLNTAKGRMLLWVFQDVSEIVRINRTLRDVSANRAEMLRLIPEPMAFFNKKGELMESNPSFQALFEGYVDIDLGLSCLDFEQVLLKQTSKADSFRPVCCQPRLKEHQTSYTDEFIMPGVTPRIFERTVCFDDSDSHVGSIMHFRDVTAAHEVDRMKTEFLSTAAHELRTPLANIFGYTELLTKTQFDHDRQAEVLNIIYNQSKRLSTIIDELLDLARIEARAGDAFNYGYYSLTELLIEVISEFDNELQKYQFEWRIHSDKTRIYCDADKIEQVIENLLANAIKYTPEDKPISLHLEARKHLDRDGFLITIKDEGIGMSEHDLANVFERFYRGDNSGHKPGTGLGMSIVKEIVEHHSGSINIESQLNRGSTFTVWLPTEPLSTSPELSLPNESIEA